jgi:hypothetical protein
VTSFEEADNNGSGSIEKHEWDLLLLEDKRRRIEDEDAHNASAIIGSMASIYFVSVAGVVSVFMGVTNLAKKAIEKKPQEVDSR